MTTSQLIILTSNNKSICFRLNGLEWSVEKVQGDTWSSQPLPTFLSKLHERLPLNDKDIHLIYDEIALPNVVSAIQTLIQHHATNVQLLRWQPLWQKAEAMAKKGLSAGSEQDLLAYICPMIESAFHYRDDAAQAERQRAVLDHETSMETLRQESLRLLAEKANLQSQVNALRLPEMDLLISFLPAIYENFFLTVSPQDLALMAGTIQVPTVHSTYTEPDYNTINFLKKKLQTLPPSTRSQVVDFAKSIPHKLTIRKEMMAIFEDEN